MTEDQRDWTYRLARVLGALGFNEMRIRWKLLRWQEALRRGGSRAQNRSRWVRYEHKLCRACGALNDREEENCVRCGVALPGRAGQMMGRLGLLVGVSPTIALIVVMVAIFGWMKLQQGGGVMADFTIRTLLEFGGNSPRYTVADGQWWRLATSVLLHGSLMHLGFNMWALYMVGPALEQIYGRLRVVLFFLLTGVVASLASVLMLDYPVGIGASGAIMGLFGVVCGWGHRQGTTHGRDLRNRMFRLVVIVTVFGFAMGQAGISVDHVAHIAGFVLGGAIGLAPLERLRSVLVERVLFGAELVAVLGVLAASVGCFLAPSLVDSRSGPQDLLRQFAEPTPEQLAEGYLRLYPPCQAFVQGDETPLRTMLGISDRQTLVNICRGPEEMSHRCTLYRSGGLEAVLGAHDGVVLRHRSETDAFYTRVCAVLPAPPPSSERINYPRREEPARRTR